MAGERMRPARRRLDPAMVGGFDARIWREHAEELTRFAAVLAGPDDAQDIAVEAFLRCAPHLRNGGVTNPRAYLFRAATNLAIDSKRKHARQRRIETEAAIRADGGHADTFDPVIGRAVASLSPRQRAIVYLAYWDDRSEREIAETLGLHVGTVRRHLHRAHVDIIDVAGRTDPDAHEVRVTFPGGADITVAVQDDGYFVVSLADDPARFAGEPVFQPQPDEAALG